MLNSKRFLILKPLSDNISPNASCVAKITTENNQTVIFCEILKGNNKLSVCGEIDGNVYDFSNENSLKFKKTISGTLHDGASVILYDKTEFLPLMYADFGKVIFNPQQVVEKIKKQCLSSSYDDDIIATENYYEGENCEAKRFSIEFGDRNCQDKEESPKTEKECRTILYENECREREKQGYYQQIKKTLDNIFSSHQIDDELCSLVPNGEFVKIYYDNERFYSVGKVNGNENTLYICYAVKGDYSTTPPALKPYCKFIPSSPFNPRGNGYFIIFQSATTGEIVKD